MTKKEAAAIFGGTQVQLAEALGLTKQAINAWPAQLRQAHIDRVVGAAVLQGKSLPIGVSEAIRKNRTAAENGTGQGAGVCLG